MGGYYGLVIMLHPYRFHAYNLQAAEFDSLFLICSENIPIEM